MSLFERIGSVDELESQPQETMWYERGIIHLPNDKNIKRMEDTSEQRLIKNRMIIPVSLGIEGNQKRVFYARVYIPKEILELDRDTIQQNVKNSVTNDIIQAQISFIATHILSEDGVYNSHFRFEREEGTFKIYDFGKQEVLEQLYNLRNWSEKDGPVNTIINLNENRKFDFGAKRICTLRDQRNLLSILNLIERDEIEIETEDPDEYVVEGKVYVAGNTLEKALDNINSIYEEVLHLASFDSA